MQFVEAWRDDIIQLDVHSAVASEAIKVLSRRQEASSASTPSLDGVEASNEAIQVAITRIKYPAITPIGLSRTSHVCAMMVPLVLWSPNP